MKRQLLVVACGLYMAAVGYVVNILPPGERNAAHPVGLLLTLTIPIAFVVMIVQIVRSVKEPENRQSLRNFFDTPYGTVVGLVLIYGTAGLAILFAVVVLGFKGFGGS